MTTRDGRREAPTPVPSFGARKKPSFLLALGLILGAACALGFATGTLRLGRLSGLVVRDAGGKRVALVALPEGRFVHSYIHSIHHSRVDEYFRVEGSLMKLYELRYDTTSVGMPSDAEGGYRLEGGRFILSMDRSFERIPLAVSHIPGHGLLVGERFYAFADWVPIEESLVLAARTRPVLRIGIPTGR